MKTRVLTSLALGLSLAACATSTPLPEVQRPTLSGSWTLQRGSNLPAAPGDVRMMLRTAPPRQGEPALAVSGFSGVNYFRGEALVDTDQQRLMVGTLAATRERGPAQRMQFESRFLGQMEQVVQFQWQDPATLVLRTLSGDTLTFAQASR